MGSLCLNIVTDQDLVASMVPAEIMVDVTVCEVRDLPPHPGTGAPVVPYVMVTYQDETLITQTTQTSSSMSGSDALMLRLGMFRFFVTADKFVNDRFLVATLMDQRGDPSTGPLRVGKLGWEVQIKPEMSGQLEMDWITVRDDQSREIINPASGMPCQVRLGVRCMHLAPSVGKLLATNNSPPDDAATREFTLAAPTSPEPAPSKLKTNQVEKVERRTIRHQDNEQLLNKFLGDAMGRCEQSVSSGSAILLPPLLILFVLGAVLGVIAVILILKRVPYELTSIGYIVAPTGFLVALVSVFGMVQYRDAFGSANSEVPPNSQRHSMPQLLKILNH